MSLKDLIQAGDADLLARARAALAATPSRHERAEVAYSGLLWLEAYGHATPMCLRVLQFEAGVAQRARLSGDLGALGLGASATAAAAMVAEADACFERGKGFGNLPYQRVLSNSLEASDTLLNAAKDIAKDCSDTEADVKAALGAYLTEHAFAFEGVEVPQKRKGLFGRLFG